MTALRLKQPYKIWPIGHIIPELPDNVARALIARGVGEEIKAAQAPANRMMSAPVTRANQNKPTMKLR